MYLEPKQVESIARIAYPGYKGRTYRWETREEYQMQDYWFEGSRTHVRALIEVSGQLRVGYPQGCDNPMQASAHARFQIPDNVLLVEHIIFCGKDLGIRFVTSPGSIFNPKLVPENQDSILTMNEEIVLMATKGLKSSYGGIKDYRFHEANRDTGITRDEWENSKRLLTNMGYLDKRGALTLQGKNQKLSKYHLFEYREKKNEKDHASNIQTDC